MTEAEEMAVKVVIKKITEESINDGIMAAVEMIRIAAQKHPEWTFNQLANCIEATVTKDKT
jgi:DNA-binding transcriptional regulator WhiA